MKASDLKRKASDSYHGHCQECFGKTSTTIYSKGYVNGWSDAMNEVNRLLDSYLTDLELIGELKNLVSHAGE